MKNKKIYLKKEKAFLEFIIGCLLIALSYNLTIAPNNFVPGGVGGLAVIMKSLLGWDNAHFILIVNLSLLLLSLMVLGKNKTKQTVLGTITVPILIEITKYSNVWIHIDNSNVLLSAIVGGVLYGIGLGLVFKGGYTTGGTDIINQIMSKYLKISLGKSMLLSDGFIVLLSGFYFSPKIMLYSILILYIISFMSDRIVLGTSNNKMFYIFSEKEDEIKNYIINSLKNKVTILKSTGGTSSKTYNIIMTVLPTRMYYELKTHVMEIDGGSFILVTDSYEVFGGDILG